MYIQFSINCFCYASILFFAFVFLLFQNESYQSVKQACCDWWIAIGMCDLCDWTNGHKLIIYNTRHTMCDSLTLNDALMLLIIVQCCKFQCMYNPHQSGWFVLTTMSEYLLILPAIIMAMVDQMILIIIKSNHVQCRQLYVTVNDL